MNIVTIKESAAFPEIGQVRKGLAKNEKGYVGKDLGLRFRLIFFSGDENERSRKRFVELHRQDGETVGRDVIVPRLTIFLPFPDPFTCWTTAYEAYTAGRMVARADGERFVRWIDTKTGDVKVSNGEPYTAFDPKMVVGSYKNAKGEAVVIKTKAIGRLRVFLPELVRMAYFTVHTTSIYDVVHITEQLLAIEWIARYLPNRNGVAGIPLMLSRRMTDVTWVQNDGSARRVQTGLINIEADPDWVERMLRSMSNMALPAQIGDEDRLRKALQPGEQVKLDIPEENQEQAGQQADGQDPEFIDGEFADEQEAQGEPSQAGSAQTPSTNGRTPIYQAVVDAKLSDNLFAAKKALEGCSTGYDTPEKAVAWMRPYRAWRDTGADSKTAAAHANKGELPK